MKKILIALPLVLIMILSMVPVMAAEKEISVDVTYYGEPTQKNVVKTETVKVKIDEANLTDKAKLEAAVKAALEKDLVFPKLNAVEQPKWKINVTGKPQSQADSTYSLVTTTKVTGVTVADLIKNTEGKAEYKLGTIGAVENGYTYASQALVTKVNAVVKAIADGTFDPATQSKIELDTGDKSEKPVEVDEVLSLKENAGKVTEAEASAVAFPDRFVEEKEEEEDKWCPELCKEITVEAINIYTGKEVEDLRRVYDVNPKKLPTYDAMINHWTSTVLDPLKRNNPMRAYQVVKRWNGFESILVPGTVEKNCVISIGVLPLYQKVNVYHVLRDCCINLDGDIEYQVWRVFEERNQVVEFIEYHSDLVINQAKAKDYASTRLQKINANDFVFFDAYFDDGVRLDGYMTGKVYDFKGNLVDIVFDENPSITIVYNRVGCEKEEEQVDNATVENNTNTQAPVTASGTQLPATGAKDVTAFFLSAVALLGLGIFFAKKH